MLYNGSGWNRYTRKADPDIYTDFDAAQKYLSRARNGYSRPLGKHAAIIANCGRDTPLENEHAFISIRLYSTDVIRLYANGDTEFDNGGWLTPTTSSWIDKNRNFRVGSAYNKGRWWAYHRGSVDRATNRLRRQFDLPSVQEVRWIDSRYSSFYTNANEETRARIEAYLAEPLRLPKYVFESDIPLRFSNRGRCLTEGAELYWQVLNRERREAARRKRLIHSAMSCSWKAIRRLRSGLIIPSHDGCDDGRLEAIFASRRHLTNRSVCGNLVRTAVERWLIGRGHDGADWRYWLNLHFNDHNNMVLGGPNLPRAVEPHVRKAVYGYLTALI